MNRSPSAALRALAVWAGPVLFITVAARVFAGAPNAPLLLLAALVAPLAALLQSPTEDDDPAPVTAIVLCGSAAVLLWANVLAIGDAAAALGVDRWRGVAVAGACALIVALWRPLAARAVGAAVIGIILAIAAVGGLGMVTGIAPWAAWRETSAQLALDFTDGSVWVNEGRALGEASTLTFAESHRVTAESAATWRVTEREGGETTTREWKLSPGDALTLRPGDRLALDAHARVRFETGKRVPGALASGVAWADPDRGIAAAVHFVGTVLTLIGGALVLLRPRRRLSRVGAVGAPASLVIALLVAGAAGIYAAHAGAELGLGASARAPFLRAPALLLSPPASVALTATAAGGLLALFVGTAAALRERVVAAVAAADPPRLLRLHPDLLWIAMLGVVICASVRPADAWHVMLAGCGLAACAWTAGPAENYGERAVAVGVACGATLFVALTLARPMLPWGVAALAAYPALVAVPFAHVIAAAAGAVFGTAARSYR